MTAHYGFSWLYYDYTNQPGGAALLDAINAENFIPAQDGIDLVPQIAIYPRFGSQHLRELRPTRHPSRTDENTSIQRRPGAGERQHHQPCRPIRLSVGYRRAGHEVDPALAAVLQLKTEGTASVVGVGVYARAPLTELDTVEAAFHKAEKVLAVIQELGQTALADRRVRGVLAGNFLEHFDLLIDYPHSIVCLDDSAEMRKKVKGERIPFLSQAGAQGRLAGYSKADHFGACARDREADASPAIGFGDQFAVVVWSRRRLEAGADDGCPVTEPWNGRLGARVRRDGLAGCSSGSTFAAPDPVCDADECGQEFTEI